MIRRAALSLAILLIGLGTATAAAADEPPPLTALLPDTVFAQFGTGGGTRELSAGLQWAWGRHWPLAGGQVGGHWELSMSEWRHRSATGSDSAWLGKLGLIPVFRYSHGSSRWFVEFGIGLTLMSNIYETERKRFSTSFNFSDHLALGHAFGAAREHEIALRVEHFSNAGIKRPNPGENFVQLRYVRRFR